MSMYKSHVVTGRIIEINADRVLTQQGEMFCSFHPRYYMLPDVETWTPEECDLKEEPVIILHEQSGGQSLKRRWSSMRPWFPHKKSANRI
ncbi:hypothetical protein [Paenibacillus sp. P46E]|uniref:hypothetical protein n=1 Tax=Paenibacillus sp. P46E TaxID=1349436 RepID=UPI000B2A8C70|nr:hypothetical protein [Paenibacillus sp. P46E]